MERRSPHSRPYTAALAYALEGGRLTWEIDPVRDVDVDTLLSGPILDKQERNEVDSWLRELLANRPMDSREVKREAERAGISWRTVWRAKQRLGVDAVKLGFGSDGKWCWMLPDSKSATKSAGEDGVAALAGNLKNTPDLSDES